MQACFLMLYLSTAAALAVEPTYPKKYTKRASDEGRSKSPTYGQSRTVNTSNYNFEKPSQSPKHYSSDSDEQMTADEKFIKSLLERK